ncbi:homeobox-domain-containing protein [Daedalea quercina L-15889]|uniref:Homeobox-domain-containing protein n=1 Tax=Daedalea quercina L-15889 TaxID=1314783 RepID=A0A165MYH6_9APHY|nr:homeobox-domain-containing protein [Daedalea quercina L-15889]
MGFWRRGETNDFGGDGARGDMADNEGEAGPSQPSQTAQPATAPPKKKRTRTLTTPHQSAVLHALLAQSRFPTTAMREEVGRAIGLSARKVQIWFQNQRQKARRPRGQQIAPLTRPPQFGPFTNVPPGSSGDASAVAGPSTLHAQPSAASGSGSSTGVPPLMRGSGPSGADFFAHQEPHMSTQYPRSGTLPQLSGPGIPGPSSTGLPHLSLPSEPRGTLPYSEAQRGIPASSPVQLFPPPSPFGVDDPSREHPASAGGSRRFSDEPRMPQRITLPPIVVDPREGILGSTSRYPPPLQLHPVSPSHLAPPAVGLRRISYGQEQAEVPFAHLPPLNIPPPFTMEPRPQWDDPAFSPFSRPGSSSRRPSSYAIPPSTNFPIPPVEAMTTRPSETLPPILPRHVERVDDPHVLSMPHSLRTRPDYSRLEEHPSRATTPRAGTRSRHHDETTHPGR